MEIGPKLQPTTAPVPDGMGTGSQRVWMGRAVARGRRREAGLLQGAALAADSPVTETRRWPMAEMSCFAMKAGGGVGRGGGAGRGLR